MSKTKYNQLSIFHEVFYPLYLDTQCQLCGSNFKVLEVLSLLPGKKIRQFVHLCSECRSHPADKEE